MLLKKSKLKVKWYMRMWSYIVVATCKMTTWLSDGVSFIKAYFKTLWASIKQIYAHMSWGNIWSGIKLMFMSAIMSWKLASDEVKTIQDNRNKSIASNLRLEAPEGYYQQAKLYLMQ